MQILLSYTEIIRFPIVFRNSLLLHHFSTKLIMKPSRQQGRQGCGGIDYYIINTEGALPVSSERRI